MTTRANSLPKEEQYQDLFGSRSIDNHPCTAVRCSGVKKNDMPEVYLDATTLTPEDRVEIETLTAAYSDHAMVSDREGLTELFHPDALRAIPGIWKGAGGSR